VERRKHWGSDNSRAAEGLAWWRAPSGKAGARDSVWDAWRPQREARNKQAAHLETDGDTERREAKSRSAIDLAPGV
jgi:hypothetical protein